MFYYFLEFSFDYIILNWLILFFEPKNYKNSGIMSQISDILSSILISLNFSTKLKTISLNGSIFGLNLILYYFPFLGSNPLD